MSDRKIEQLTMEAQWVRVKLGLAIDTPFNEGEGAMLTIALHQLTSEAHGYRAYIAAYKCDDKQGEIARLTVALKDAEERIEKLQAFKDYTHDRLTEAGVPERPTMPANHTAAGCRIGDRLDWLFSQDIRLVPCPAI
jgi:hypothetical protein